VWAQIEARHGQLPASRVGDVNLGKTIVIRMDATIQIAHSDKQGAAGTFKGSFGHHPLAAWCDNTGEALALRLRPGNAGSNTASDHITVLTEAIAQLPARHRRDLLITVDGAGSTLDLIRHITTLNAVPGRRVHYSVGFDLDHRGRTAIGKVPEHVWEQVCDRDGEPRDPDNAGVVELTRLLRASAGGDVLANWPGDMRIICRRERPGAGAQLCATNTPRGQVAFLEARHRVHARVEDRCGKATGPQSHRLRGATCRCPRCRTAVKGPFDPCQSDAGRCKLTPAAPVQFVPRILLTSFSPLLSGCPFTGPVELGLCAGFDLGRPRRRVGLILGP